MSKQAGGVKRVVEELAYAFFNDDFRKGKSFLDWLSKQPEFGYQLLKTNGKGKFMNPAMPAMLERYQSRGGSRYAASDRKSLIKLASELPKGSDERRAILAGLKQAAAFRRGDKVLVPAGSEVMYEKKESWGGSLVTRTLKKETGFIVEEDVGASTPDHRQFGDSLDLRMDPEGPGAMRGAWAKKRWFAKKKDAVKR
jgi:hypothetical protein